MQLPRTEMLTAKPSLKLAIPTMILVMLWACQTVPISANASSDKDVQLQELIATFTGMYRGTAPIPGAASSPGIRKGLVEKNQTTSAPTMTIFQNISRVEAPQFGETVLYHTMTRDSIDGFTLQQKIYVFDTTPERSNNRMKAYYVLSDIDKAKLEKNVSAVKDLDPNTLMSFPVECVINWEKAASTFIARVKKEDCSYQSSMLKKTVRPDMTYTVDADAFDLFEAMYTLDGNTVFKMDRPISAKRITK